MSNYCQPSVSNCVEFSDSTTCKQCVNTYTLVSNECNPPASRLLENASLVFSFRKSPVISNLLKIRNDEETSRILTASPLSIQDESSSCGGSEYYDIGTFTCQERTLIDSNCAEFSKNSDSCSKCNANYFLNHKFRCSFVPLGVLNCAEHSGLSSAQFDLTSLPTCSKCDSGYILSADSLECALASPAISNCSVQSSQTTCEECVSGYYLSNNSCSKSRVINCKEAVNESSCDRCKDHYTLQEDGSSGQKCVYSRIEGCEEHDLSDAFSISCEKCGMNYFVSDSGSCTKVENVIEFCVKYSSDGECEECEESFYLDESQKSCISFQRSYHLQNNADKKCTKAVALDDKCGVCKVGFYADESGKCVSCATSNCAVCNGRGVCLVCLSGFYMDLQKQCLSSGLETSRTIEEISKYSEIMIDLMMIFYLLILL